MNIKVGDHKNVTYKSYSELRVAFARHGISMEALEKLKQLELESNEKKKAITSNGNGKEGH